MDLKQIFQEWYVSQVSRWHSEGTPKEVIAQESFFFGVQAVEQQRVPDAASLEAPDDTTGAFDDSIIGSLP